MKDEEVYIELFEEEPQNLTPEERLQRLREEFFSILTSREERIARAYIQCRDDRMPHEDAYRAVAAEIGISEDAVLAYLARAIRKLRRHDPDVRKERLQKILGPEEECEDIV